MKYLVMLLAFGLVGCGGSSGSSVPSIVPVCKSLFNSWSNTNVSLDLSGMEYDTPKAPFTLQYAGESCVMALNVNASSFSILLYPSNPVICNDIPSVVSYDKSCDSLTIGSEVLK